MIATKKQALEIVGGLSNASKLPFWSYGLSAWDCKTGSKLAKIKDTPCYKCYARQGSYTAYPNVRKAHDRRLRLLGDSRHVSAMSFLLKDQSHFRWFDSGDIQNYKHMEKIIDIAKQTPNCSFWLPTQEREIVSKYKSRIPQNITVRISQAKIGQVPKLIKDLTKPLSHSSMIYRKEQESTLPKHVFKCLAPLQNNQCKNCRACFDQSIQCVGYLEHGKEVPLIQIGGK